MKIYFHILLLSFQKFTTVPYCFGGRHRSATRQFVGDITSKGSKVLKGHCPIGNRKKSNTVSVNTIAAQSLGDFIKFLSRIGINASKKLSINVVKKP